MNNPLLTAETLPPFSKIEPEHIEPAIDYLLEQCRALVNIKTQLTEPFSWENFVDPIEKVEDRLNNILPPVPGQSSPVIPFAAAHIATPQTDQPTNRPTD